MMTRGSVAHQYGPLCHPAVAPMVTGPAIAYGPGGGLAGGAVTLNMGASGVGIRRGRTGYGYLGLDPSDPNTWIVRPFNPAPGMIAYLNGVAR